MKRLILGLSSLAIFITSVGLLPIGASAVDSDVITVTAVESAQLMNGSFERVSDAMMPIGWSSFDPNIEASFNGVRRYEMDQASEPVFANFLKTNDTDGYLSGTHNAEDSTGVYGKKTVQLKGAKGIDKDYEGIVYTNKCGKQRQRRRTECQGI